MFIRKIAQGLLGFISLALIIIALGWKGPLIQKKVNPRDYWTKEVQSLERQIESDRLRISRARREISAKRHTNKIESEKLLQSLVETGVDSLSARETSRKYFETLAYADSVLLKASTISLERHLDELQIARNHLEEQTAR